MELAHFLVQRGHRVTIIASQVSYLTGKAQVRQASLETPASLDDGITVIRAYTYSALHRSFLHRVLSFLSFMVSSFLAGMRVRKVDVVWGTSPPIFQGFTAWLLARLKGAAFLFEVRDLWPAFAIAIGVLHNRVLIRASLWLERFLYRHADRVVVNSPGFIDHVTSRGAHRVDLIPNGADPEMFAPEKNGYAFRCEHHLENKFIVMYAGAHGISNDLGIVLAAADALRKDLSIHFVFLGDGKEKPTLQIDARARELTNVTFLPPVAKLQMAEILSAADACLAILKPLELYKTTYPNKVFDYMAAGRPVLLAIDGVIRAVVEDAQGGIAVPPGNSSALAAAVHTLARDPMKAKEMGQNGRRYVVQHFTRSQSAEKLALLLEEMR